MQEGNSREIPTKFIFTEEENHELFETVVPIISKALKKSLEKIAKFDVRIAALLEKNLDTEGLARNAFAYNEDHLIEGIERALMYQSEALDTAYEEHFKSVKEHHTNYAVKL